MQMWLEACLGPAASIKYSLSVPLQLQLRGDEGGRVLGQLRAPGSVAAPGRNVEC